MILKQMLSQKWKIEKELSKINRHLSDLKKSIFEFEGVQCYIDEYHISENKVEVELLTISTTRKKFRNGSECIFISAEEFEEKAKIVGPLD